MAEGSPGIHRRLSVFAGAVALCLFGPARPMPAETGVARSKAAGDGCAGCHPDLAKVLPKNHVDVKETGLAACAGCHHVGQSGEATRNAFSTRLHLAHAAGGTPDCIGCHAYAAKKRFGLIGLEHSWGSPDDEDLALMKSALRSWAGSTFTDRAHAKAGIDCAGCHGKTAPVSDATVENDRCLACHGPIEKLAARSANPEWPKRNPHDSHLGAEVACTACHHAHSASVVYCADCHRLWKLTIPGRSDP